MFGLFSLPKILFTIGVIAAVWYGFKWYNRRQQMADQSAKRESVGESAPNKSTKKPVEDMVQCPDCGAFVPADGRHDCA